MASKLRSKYWHYRLSNTIDPVTQRPVWGETRLDLELRKLQSEIVQPWKSRRPFNVNGAKFCSSSSYIQIIWTSKASNDYMDGDYQWLLVKKAATIFNRPSDTVKVAGDTLQEASKIRRMASQRVFDVSDKVDYTNELLVSTDGQQLSQLPTRSKSRSPMPIDENNPLIPSKVFISYSHKDKKFKEELETHLKPMMRNGVSCWSDKQIQPGSKWMNEIEDALEHATVAVLLVSPSFLSSEFIHNHELSPLLERAKNGSIHVLWVLVRSCAYKETSIKDYQAAYSIEKPLAEMKAERDRAWNAICNIIKQAAASDSRGDTGSASLFR